ncbi:MAG TPA: M3 family metallopeptidase [Acidobacteriaceae bacterium]|jgi:thimet oligopeptidase
MNATDAVVSGRHAWSLASTTEVTPENLENWVAVRLSSHQVSLDHLTGAGERTLESTWRPYDEAIAVLSQAGSECGLLDSVHPSKPVRDKAQQLAQRVAEAATALSLNQEVYRALASVDASRADEATKHYVERTLLQYRLAGVDKDDATRARLRELQDKATLLSLTIGRNVQEGTLKVEITDLSELEGLPEDFRKNHPPDEAGKVVLTTDYPDYLPVMTFAASDALRRRMFLAYNMRAFPANRELLLELFRTRYAIAKLLGFATWADFATADQMIGSAANVKKFLERLEQSTRAGADREYGIIFDFARSERPGLDAIDAASRGYWLEQYRRREFAFDSQAVRPYFPYQQVEAGVLATASRLFKVEFRPAADAEVWHPSVSAWDVFDGGRNVGRFYLDMHPREGKDKWFSAAPLVPGIAGRQIPEAALICNFPGGAANFPGGDEKSGGLNGDPGLMQHSDVVTYFHEFGHLMHAILGGQQGWAGISGIATEGDFVEVPSQMLEEFFRDAKLLETFARHYVTGEPIPAELVATMNQAGAFGRADWVRTQLFYTNYALDVHDQDPGALDLDVLLRADYERFLPYRWIDGNRMYASFTHLCGYSSNYYTYLYDKVIAIDFFNQFDRAALLEDPATMRYRKSVLDKGGSAPGRALVQGFLGRDESMEAFEEWIGEALATV